MSANNVIPDQNTDPSFPTRYPNELSTLHSIFESWSELDLLSVLDETQGNLELAISWISEGQAVQWAIKSKKKDRKISDDGSILQSTITRGGRRARGRIGPSGPSGPSSRNDRNVPKVHLPTIHLPKIDSSKIDLPKVQVPIVPAPIVHAPIVHVNSDMIQEIDNQVKVIHNKKLHVAVDQSKAKIKKPHGSVKSIAITNKISANTPNNWAQVVTRSDEIVKTESVETKVVTERKISSPEKVLVPKTSSIKTVPEKKKIISTNKIQDTENSKVDVSRTPILLLAKQTVTNLPMARKTEIESLSLKSISPEIQDTPILLLAKQTVTNLSMARKTEIESLSLKSISPEIHDAPILSLKSMNAPILQLASEKTYITGQALEKLSSPTQFRYESPPLVLQPEKNNVSKPSSLPPGLSQSIEPKQPKQSNQLKVQQEGINALPVNQIPPALGVKLRTFRQDDSSVQSPEKSDEALQFPYHDRHGQTSINQSQSQPQSNAYLQYQPQFPAAMNYQYGSDVQRQMGYYAPESSSYDTTKFGSESTPGTSNQIPSNHPGNEGMPNLNLNNEENMAMNGHQQNFQPYPYYPYYMNPNQFQQAPYQPHLYGQQLEKQYGNFPNQFAPLVPSPSMSVNTASTKASNNLNFQSNQVPSNQYISHQFYPAPIYDHDYNKPYAQNYSNFGPSHQNKNESRGGVDRGLGSRGFSRQYKGDDMQGGYFPQQPQYPPMAYQQYPNYSHQLQQPQIHPQSNQFQTAVPSPRPQSHQQTTQMQQPIQSQQSQSQRPIPAQHAQPTQQLNQMQYTQQRGQQGQWNANNYE